MRFGSTILALLGIVLLAAPLGAQEELLLGDFEGKLDPGWERNGDQSALSFVTEHATRGGRAVKVLLRGEYPGISLTRPASSDWSKYDTLKIDLFNPSEEVLRMQINLRDRASGPEYQNRANLGFRVRPGPTTFELSLSGLKTTGGRVMDRTHVASLLIMFAAPKEPVEVFIDSVRLVKEKPLEVAGLEAFDFGPADSPVFPGFTLVTERTAYDDRTGFGWLDTRNLVSADRVTPGVLERDWVRGAATFAVKVPNGKYHVWMLSADSGDWCFREHWSEKRIKAQGRTVYERRMTHDEFLKQFFANLDVEDLPGQDVYMLYVESRWWPVEFDVEVTGGRLEVSLEGDPWATLVNAIVLYPFSQRDAGDAWLKNLADRRRRDFYMKFVEVPVPEKRVEVFPNETEKKRGYVVFQRPWSEPVWPTSSPRGGGQEIDALEVTLAQGEFEPVTFSIYPFQDLGKVRVTADVPFPMRADRTTVDVGYVQYKVKRTEFQGTAYQSRPTLIRKRNELRIDRGVTRRFWLTVVAPQDIAGGTYRGSVTITPEHGEPTMLPLTVTVLDFVLGETKDRMFALSGTNPQPFHEWVNGSSDATWKAFEASWRNQRNHGFNTPVTGSDLETVRKIMTAAKPMGLASQFKCWLPYQNRYREGVVSDAEKRMRPIVEAAKANGWPEPVFTFLDEPSNGGESSRSEALKLASALRSIRKVKLAGDLNSPADEVFFPLLDYSGIGDGCRISPATLQKIRDAHSTPWLVNAGKERFWWGVAFYALSKQYDVRLKEDYAYMTWHGDPFFDLDAANSDYCAAYPGPDGDINTPWFEECREGIDDFWYLWTLDYLTKAAKEISAPPMREPAKEGEGFLTDLCGQVDPDWSKNRPWSYERCQEVRRRAAELITKRRAARVPLPQ